MTDRIYGTTVIGLFKHVKWTEAWSIEKSSISGVVPFYILLTAIIGVIHIGKETIFYKRGWGEPNAYVYFVTSNLNHL